MVYDAVGIAGLICVVVAGWTTANPTIYRAGLAIQGVFPGMARRSGTLVAGIVCTVAGVFPAVAMKLLDFVGIYGTILAPIGAVIVVDHFLASRLGIEPQPAARSRASFNVSVMVAWLVPVALGLWVYVRFGVPAFFLPLPSWLACGLLYIVFQKLKGGRREASLRQSPVSGRSEFAHSNQSPVKAARAQTAEGAFRILALLGLTAAIVPPILYALRYMGEGPMKAAMLVGAILWFGVAPFWLKGGEH